MKPKLVICYHYFLPAYKAGGPIQSIANLVRNLKSEFEFYIICSNHDHNETATLKNIEPNQWSDFENGTAKVYYASKNNLLLKTFYGLFKPDVIFVNGLYSFWFTIVPLIFLKAHKIISVRGMLHPGALSQKSLKKKLFLTALKFSGITKNCTFHVTDEKEKEYTKMVFGEKAKIKIAPNFPSFLNPQTVNKKQGELNLISIALVSPMKNHLLVLKSLSDAKQNINYRIYGPIKDSTYWEECKTTIKSIPQNVKVEYMGEINPTKIEEALRWSHAFILPSKSENFGHAIVEALSAGKPVISSKNIPWNDLETHHCGFNIAPEDTNAMAEKIVYLANLGNDEYQLMSKNAANYIRQKIDIASTIRAYRELFSA